MYFAWQSKILMGRRSLVQSEGLFYDGQQVTSPFSAQLDSGAAFVRIHKISFEARTHTWSSQMHAGEDLAEDIYSHVCAAHI